MKLAYILNTYPQRSHSFIRREIHALERRGHDISRIAMRAAIEPMIDPADIAETSKTQHILRSGAASLLGAVLWHLFRHPKRLLGAFRLAI